MAWQREKGKARAAGLPRLRPHCRGPPAAPAALLRRVVRETGHTPLTPLCSAATDRVLVCASKKFPARSRERDREKRQFLRRIKSTRNNYISKSSKAADKNH